MTPDELAEIRRRDAGARTVNEIGAHIPCTQDRRDLLAEVERLTRELDNANARISYMCTEIGKVADFETARPTKAIDAVRTLAQMANEGYGWKAERAEALAAIERVRELHTSSGGLIPTCETCSCEEALGGMADCFASVRWPCPTITILDAADGAHQQQTGGETDG